MELRITQGYPENINEIEALFRSFGDFNQVFLEHALRNRVDITCVYAYQEDTLIGCKIGYSPRPLYFESWIGGVHQNYQRRGIAMKLSVALHENCKKNGYRFVETITSNNNLPMQLVNLKTGMKVVGTFLDRGKELKLNFQKEL